MIETYTLDAEFANSNGKSQHLRIKDVDPTKTADEIKAALTKMTKLTLFEKDGVGLYKEVLHATRIKKTVKPIFDDQTKEVIQTPSPMMMETEPLSVKEDALQQVQEPVDTIENIRIPEDLTIIEEIPEPGVLIQNIELPMGIDPWSLNEEQAGILLLSCVPNGASLINIEINDQVAPPRLIVTSGIEQESLPAETPTATQSPPAKPKKARNRRLNRIRKQE
ncbi:DUF2922 family protein [Enterococcus sp. AZ196]|uniref:DUF2922 family protein n=1 Tax=Enterococcus sp. AZ196 TaxID=2774659 RepID=UPI003D2DF23E